MLMCPHCGWQYPEPGPANHLVPNHMLLYRYPSTMTAGALDAGAECEEVLCPGSQQGPRNAESDLRFLWNGERPRIAR